MERLKSRGLRWILVLLALIIVILLTVRACSGGMMMLKNHFVIGRDVTWRPFDLGGKEANMVGFTQDMIQDIESKEEIEITIHDVGTGSLIFGLTSGQWDGIFSSIDPSPYNETRYYFSEPFYLSGLVLVVRSDSEIKGLEDLDGKIVGIVKDTALSPSVTRYSAIFSPYAKVSAALHDLVNNSLDAVIMEFEDAHVYSQSIHRNKIKVVTAPMLDQALRLVTLKNMEGRRLIHYFNFGLEQMKNDGQYNNLLIKWGLVAPKDVSP